MPLTPGRSALWPLRLTAAALIICEKFSLGMFPAQNKLVGVPNEFGERVHIRDSLILKGQPVIARFSGECEDIRIRRIV
jgi:hypothetical protein